MTKDTIEQLREENAQLQQQLEKLQEQNDRQCRTIERLVNRSAILEENDRLKQEVKELQECNDRQKATIEHFMAPDPHRATLLEENQNLKYEVEVLRNNDRLNREQNFPYMIKEKTYQEEQLDKLDILSCQTFEQRVNATIAMYKLEREATGKLRSLLRRMALSMKAHPDWQPDSEFADYVESAEELLEETTGLGAPETEVLEAEKEKDVEHLHAKEEEQGPFDSIYSPLFDFFQQNHDLTLLHGEMDDIVHAVDKMAGYTATINRLEKEYAEALEELSKVQETTMALIEREGEIWKAFGQFSAAMVSVLKKQDNA